jgi:hypothetical protein
MVEARSFIIFPICYILLLFDELIEIYNNSSSLLKNALNQLHTYKAVKCHF